MDPEPLLEPELLPGFGIKVPDPAKSERAVNKTSHSGLYYWTVVLNREWQIVV